MQLFEKWQSVTDAYKSFYEEAEHLGLEVLIFLKHFCEAILNTQCGSDKNIEKGFICIKPRFFLEKEKKLIERILK